MGLLKSAIDEAAIVAITDAKGIITYVNKKFCDISQYSAEELIGKTHRVINSGLHEKEFFAEMWKVITVGKIWEGQIRNRAKDGSIYWVNTTIVPFLDDAGKPVQYVAVRYDITHRKLAEEQVIQQDRMASLGLLASSLAHEIGTPLGIIRSRAELVERKVSDVGVKQDMGTVITQIDRIAKLVHSLLNLAREKKSELATAVPLNGVVQDVLNLMQHELDRKNILLDLQFEDGISVKAESGPLGQVLLNLLVNSVHAIEEARAKGYEEDHKIAFRVETLGENALISVSDTGCGIEEKNMSQLFKPFFTTKDIGQGTGLGLATSFRLVQSWGGSIGATSKAGHGSTFKVKLLRS